MFYLIVLYDILLHLSAVRENGEAEYSTTSSSVQYGHMHGPTHFHALYSAFAFIVGLFCITVIILISVWRYRRHQMFMNVVARRHSGRRLISTYPQLQVISGVATHATVTLPPPYCEAVATPPPYSTVDRRQQISADPQPNRISVAVGSACESAQESDNLLSQQI